MNRYLEALLEYYWLRPETAVWRAIDCAELDPISFRSPILDFGCGDGSLSFMRAGGRYSIDYDFASQTGQLDQFFTNVDIYNSFDSSRLSGSIVADATSYQIDVGLDHKPALLQKAMLTGLYKTTVSADGNRELPFDDGSFNTIYSNILYWLDRPQDSLREICRILSHDGELIVQVPSDRFREFSFYQRFYARTKDPAWEWLSLIDRGRSDNIKHCQSEEQWSDVFWHAGFEVTSCRSYLSRLVIEAWDIGLRPVSPYLIEMANALSRDRRETVKRKWVDGLLPILAPLCEHKSDENGFLLFRLKRRSPVLGSA
jgi:SAM-dependent methyltransferase